MEAVTKGLASDNGLFMPERIEEFHPDFFKGIHKMSFPEISFEVANKFFGEDIPEHILDEIVFDTLNFDCPVLNIRSNYFMGQRWLLKMLAPGLWPACWPSF
jgi:threonine synthase